MAGGRRNPSGEDGGSLLAQTQSFQELTAHGGVKGGRSQGGVEAADNSWVTTDGDKADGSTGVDGEPMALSDIAGSGGLGDAAATCAVGGARVLKG